MAEREPTTEFDGRFSEPDATARPWSEVDEVLRTSEMFWLSTVRGDGRPHVTPLPTVWDGGVLHFCTGPGEQKAKNLEHDARCILTTGTNDQRSGLDVVVEGEAVRITDTARLQQLAALWKSKLDWDYAVSDGEFHQDDSAHAHVFGVRPAKVLAFGKSPYSQTRYRFDD